MNRGNLQAYRAGAALQHGDSKAYNALSKEAIEGYTKALEHVTRLVKASTPAMAYLNRGIVRAGMGDIDGAIADYTDSLRFDPSSAEAYANRAQAYVTKGAKGKGAADFETALEDSRRRIGRSGRRLRGC